MEAHVNRKLSFAVILGMVAAACSESPISPVEESAPSPSVNTVPGTFDRSIGPQRSLSPATVNMVIIDERGHISWGADAEGTGGPAESLTIPKPAGATVRRAIISAANSPFSGAVPSVNLDGVPVDWDGSADQELPFGVGRNYYADVTAQVAAKTDPLPAGNVVYAINENNSGDIEGVALVVVFEDPTVSEVFSVTVLFGSQNTDGDFFTIDFDSPFGPTGSAEMSLAISFGFQPSGQFSIIDVNGMRLTNCAGGQDDGQPANGALITMGGTGDANDNPTCINDANGTRSDDELYSLKPFIADGARTLSVVTSNPSDDDNIFLALFYLNPPGTVEAEGGGPGGEIMCEDLDEAIADFIQSNEFFSLLPAFTQNFFVQLALGLFEGLIEAVQSGELSAEDVEDLLENLQASVAANAFFSSILTDELIEGIVAFIEACEEA